MGLSIGLLELKSIPIGVQAADEMLKAADVDLLVANAICPGKYVIIICGQVGAVKSSMKVGEHAAGHACITAHIINNVHESVAPALTGTVEMDNIVSLGMIETMSALTIVRAADIAAKASNVRLLDVRVARGLGGKGYMLLTGEISSVKSAIKSCVNELGDLGDITSTCVIASPHKKLIEKLH